MQNHSKKVVLSVCLFIIGFIFVTSNELLATVPNDLITRSFVAKLSNSINQNSQPANLFGINILNNNNPTPLSNALSNVSQVSSGNNFACAINSEGKLFCWGVNNNGQLGDGTDTNTHTPILVNTNGLLDYKPVISVSAGGFHTCAVNSDGKLFCWGNNSTNTPNLVNTNGLLDDKSVISVSAGEYHTCAVNSDGRLFCWGNNNSGQLGDGTNGYGTNKTTPTFVNTNGLLGDKSVISVSAGGYHTCAVNSDGKLFC